MNWKTDGGMGGGSAFGRGIQTGVDIGRGGKAAVAQPVERRHKDLGQQLGQLAALVFVEAVYICLPI